MSHTPDPTTQHGNPKSTVDPAAKGCAVVTGASAGIGAATAVALARAGYEVVLGARRLERLQQLADTLVDEGLQARALALDVDEPSSISEFVAQVPDLRLLVNNAGGALGLESIADAKDELWERMYRTNVMGVMRMSRAFLPALIASGDGQVINVGSIAGFETYPGGAGYTAAKHALRALTRTLRLELLGQPVRVTEVDPGMVETEFSLVRFDGDQQRAAKVYEDMTPLRAEDVAECILWAASRPSHVNIDEILVRPRDQARATLVHRRPAS